MIPTTFQPAMRGLFCARESEEARMAWRSPFADGPCTITVIPNDGSPVFSDLVAAGESRTFDLPVVMEMGPATIAVSADGVVTLTGDQYGGAGGSWEIRISREPMPTTAMQVVDIEADVSTYDTNHIEVYGSEGAGDAYTALSVTYGPPSTGTPDPCPVVDPQLGVKPSMWAVYAQMTGV